MIKADASERRGAASLLILSAFRSVFISVVTTFFFVKIETFRQEKKGLRCYWRVTGYIQTHICFAVRVMPSSDDQQNL